METVSSGVPSTGFSTNRVISFGAIITGALIGLLCYFAFNLLGTGLGLVSFSVDTGSAKPGAGPVLTAVIFMVIGAVVSFALGGYVTGRMIPVRDKMNATIHGLSSYALAAVTMLVVIGSSALSSLGSLISTTGSAAATAAIQRPEAARTEADRLARNPQVQAQTREAADNLRQGIAVASFSGFLLLVIGSLSSIWGARKGVEGASFKEMFSRKEHYHDERVPTDRYDRTDRDQTPGDFPRAM